MINLRSSPQHTKLVLDFCEAYITRCEMINNGSLVQVRESSLGRQTDRQTDRPPLTHALTHTHTSACQPLPPTSQTAAFQSYMDTVNQLYVGMQNVFSKYATSSDPLAQRIYALWSSLGH